MEITRRKLLQYLVVAGISAAGSCGLNKAIERWSPEYSQARREVEHIELVKKILEGTLREDFLNKLQLDASLSDEDGNEINVSLREALKSEEFLTYRNLPDNTGIAIDVVVVAGEPLTSIYGLPPHIPIEADLQIIYGNGQGLSVGFVPDQKYNLYQDQLTETSGAVFKPEFMADVQVTPEKGIVLRLPPERLNQKTEPINSSRGPRLAKFLLLPYTFEV